MHACKALVRLRFRAPQRKSLSGTALEALGARIRACRICRDTPDGAALPHEPRPILAESSVARIVIASQAPGTRAHASGVPFDDASGARLRDWFGVSREEFFRPGNFIIAPMGFCFPGLDAAGGDLPPRRECAPAWREPLLAGMPQADLFLLVGMHAQAWHLGKRRARTLGETVARWRTVWDASDSPRMMPLPHPSWRNTSWLKRNPWFEEDVLPVLRSAIRERLLR
ncbi:MAG: uracil-DNA glycosylase [Mesorhizobium amorphae]|nr:MAG: uracil-DNA glycosylase [Mesorhizobium amorphae]